VGAAKLVEPLDEGDRIEELPIERDGDAALEADDDLEWRRRR
jgi:hypothetical protein